MTSGSGDVQAIDDQMAGCAFDDAGGDGLEYGDVLVSAGCDGTQAEARACDLAAAVEKIARLLKLT